MKRPTARLAALAAALLVWVQPAAAQSILRDAETEAMFHDMSADIVKAAGLNPRDVQIVLINDGSINAFVAGGQIVYIHSGLIEAASNANEVQGVIAHEVGHIADGHVLSGEAAMKPAMGMTILSMVLGLAAMAAGSGDAGAGIMAMGQQAAMGKYLSFSRTQESTADASAVRYLDTAGVSGKGMLTFFKKLANQEYRYGTANIDPFMQTHPLSGERIANLTADIQKSKSYNAKPDAALEERFRRVKAKLLGYVAEPSRTLAEYPETDQSLYAHYARAYAYHKGDDQRRRLGIGFDRRATARPLFPGDPGPDPAGGGQAAPGARTLAGRDRGVAQQSADRHHLWPCADRDRGQGEPARGDPRAARRHAARRRQSLGLDATGHRL